jgi:hypothetical protein
MCILDEDDVLSSYACALPHVAQPALDHLSARENVCGGHNVARGVLSTSGGTNLREFRYESDNVKL